MKARYIAVLALLGLLLAPGVVRAAPPAVALAAEDTPLCAAGATWVDMDDPKRHPAALDRAALGAYDANGDAQTCARLVADTRAGNLRVAYKALDPDTSKAAGAAASCPDDYGLVDTKQPESMPFPLHSEHLTPYDRNGDGQLCVSPPLRDEIADLALDLQVAETYARLGWCGGLPGTIVGTGGNDTIYGTPGDDIIAGQAGDDRIYGEGGNDIICGDAGEDWIISSPNGESRLYGGPDGDYLFANGTHRAYGNAGDDDLYGGRSPSHGLLDGGPDDDQLYAAHDASEEDPCPEYWTTMYGGAGNDRLYGGCGREVMFGGDDNDRLDGSYLAHEASMSDSLDGGAGNDRLDGGYGSDMHGGGDDVLWGGDGDDLLNSDAGDDVLYGGEGNDELWGHEGDDDLYGGDGNDTLYSGADDDYLYSGDGYDTLDGGEGNDDLYSGADDDNLYGGDGYDTLDGGEGNDNLYGGADDDNLYGDEYGSDLLDGGYGDYDDCFSSSSYVTFVDCELVARPFPS